MTAPLTLTQAIDQFIEDRRSEGRINSVPTETGYRGTLEKHAQDIANRAPEHVTRDDVKTTLRRWPNANTQRTRRAILISFYDWTMEEGIRTDNPARQTRRPKRKPTSVYRLTRDEARAMLDAANTRREQRVISIGILAGLRNAELRGLQGRHFERDGFIWVSADIAKGGRERWVPVVAELEPVAAEIRQTVAIDAYVLPAERWRDPGANTRKGNLEQRASSSQALRSLVMRVAKRAGIRAHIHPHLLRHAFGDHIAKYAGLKVAQYAMGHASSGTTEGYTGQPSLDELKAALAGFSFNTEPPLPGDTHKAPTGIEPVESTSRPVDRDDENTSRDDEPFLDPAIERLLAPLASQIYLYREVLV